MASIDPAVSSQVVAFLERPESYPVRPDRVETIETHLSYVFLAGAQAYKLKKPVRFEFVDFSTVELRRAACEDELRLNRRLAASIYQRVLPITVGEGGMLALDGAGTAVDWVVQMRRFDEGATLEAAIVANRVQDSELDAVCELLLDFYRRAEPAEISAVEYRAQIEQHVRANLAELLQPEYKLTAPLVRYIHLGQLRLLQHAPQVFDARVAAGRIVEGHGDLRPEHVVLETPPVVIDCLEFSRELRVLDELDELCFLAMECARLHNRAAGRRVLDRYRQSTGDDPPRALVAFYQSYRACVRAKVSALRSAQLNGSARRAALDLTVRYLVEAFRTACDLGPAALVVIGGLSGTGKSTLAAAVAAQLGALHLQTDVIRREVFGASESTVGGDERYQAENRAKVYELLFARARDALATGVTTVIDGTFLTHQSCVAALDVARESGAVPLIVRCTCPASIATERITNRLARGNSASDARPELHQQQQSELEPLPTGVDAMEIDSTLPLAEQVAAVLARLGPLVFPDVK